MPAEAKEDRRCSVVDDDDLDAPTLALDLRDLQAAVEPRPADDGQLLILVITNGHGRVELSPGASGASEAAVFGAQRLAAAALDYAAGLAMLALRGLTPPPE